MNELYVTSDMLFAVNARTDTDMIVSNLSDFNNYARNLLLGKIQPPTAIHLDVEGTYREPVPHGTAHGTMKSLFRKLCRLFIEAGVIVKVINIYHTTDQGVLDTNDMAMFMSSIGVKMGRFYSKMESIQLQEGADYAGCF